jgi:hypothetical protein
MNYLMDGHLNRRQVIGSGLTLGLALLLAGCQAGKPGGRSRWKPLTQSELDGPPRQPLAGPSGRLPQPLGPTGVVSRREWTAAMPVVRLSNPMGGIDRITIHHDGMPPVSLKSKNDVAHRLEVIRRSHTGKGWADIGYHYAVDPQGRIWECRPVQYQGAHVKDHNERNLGILVLGNFEEQTPTSAALSALDGFVADRMQAMRVPISRVLTHQEISPTACPGRHLQGYMVSTRQGRGRMVNT